jgi:BirA family transcriptional regulator, biotin operon repressor / biotin---[acetyl-CoA-carboxylase] ligase
MLPHALASLPAVERFYSFPQVGSTNDTARAMTELPLKGIFVIQADCQTDGRGRRGTPWFSPSGSALFASILTPLPGLDAHFDHNRALSFAICAALESAAGGSVDCRIKWPNDILVNGKKICGILLENHATAPGYLVIGFGVNVNSALADFPPDLRDIATSFFILTANRYSLSRLLETIVGSYLSNLRIDRLAMHDLYSRRLYGTGQTVEVGDATGVFEGVEPDGRLRMRCGREVVYRMSGHVLFTGPSPRQGRPDD